MSIATSVASWLKTDLVIASIAADRVFDYDVRTVGWNREPGTIDPITGDLRPSIVVTGQDGVQSVYGTRKVMPGALIIYAFAAESTGGRSAVDQLSERIMAVMSGWQDPTTGAVIQVDSFPTGPRADGDGGYMERISLAVNRVVPALNW